MIDICHQGESNPVVETKIRVCKQATPQSDQAVNIWSDLGLDLPQIKNSPLNVVMVNWSQVFGVVPVMIIKLH